MKKFYKKNMHQRVDQFPTLAPKSHIILKAAKEPPPTTKYTKCETKQNIQEYSTNTQMQKLTHSPKNTASPNRK